MRTPPPPKLLGTRTATSLALCGMDSSSLVLTAFPSALARRIRANLMCLVVLVYCDCGSRQLPGVRAQSVDSSFPALHTEGPRAAAPPRLASQCAQTVQSAPSAASTHYSWSPELSTRVCRYSPAAIAHLCAASATLSGARASVAVTTRGKDRGMCRGWHTARWPCPLCPLVWPDVGR